MKNLYMHGVNIFRCQIAPSIRLEPPYSVAQ